MHVSLASSLQCWMPHHIIHSAILASHVQHNRIGTNQSKHYRSIYTLIFAWNRTFKVTVTAWNKFGESPYSINIKTVVTPLGQYVVIDLVHKLTTSIKNKIKKMIKALNLTIR